MEKPGDKHKRDCTLEYLSGLYSGLAGLNGIGGLPGFKSLGVGDSQLKDIYF